MKMKSAFAIGLLALTACGGTKTVYVTSTEPPKSETAPETTVRITTTDAPIAIAPSDSLSYSKRQYVNYVYSLFDGVIVLSDEELVSIGDAICGAMDSGFSLEMVVNVIVAEYPYMNAEGQEFVSAVIASAIYNICPQHEWQIP